MKRFVNTTLQLAVIRYHIATWNIRFVMLGV